MENTAIRDSVKCRELIICDDKGQPRIELKGGSSEIPPSLSFVKEGKTQIEITVNPDSFGEFNIFDNNGKRVLTLGAKERGCGLFLFDKEGKPAVEFGLRRELS